MRQTSFIASALLVSAACIAACSSNSGSAGSGGKSSSSTGAGDASAASTTGSGGASTTTSTTGSSTTGSGGMMSNAKPILCPETDAIHPKNANTVVITDGTLSADTEWTADKTYVISVAPGAFSTPGLVVGGFKLTIDAGTVVCIDAENALGIGNSDKPGEVHINGTADKPVIFTAMPSSQDPTKPVAYHGGLDIGAFQGSTISNLEIWYGGPGGGSGAYAIRVEDTAAGTNPATPLLFDHVTIGELESSGIYLGAAVGIDPASSIHILGFAAHDAASPDYNAVAQIDFFAGKSLQKALTIDPGIPAAAAHIDLRTSTVGALDGPADLYDLGVPYHYHDMLSVAGAGAVLTLHEGTTLGLDNTITIGDFETDTKGDLVFAGTAAKPVVLTSLAAAPAAGDWNGLLFTTGEFNLGTTKIDQTQILYAGTTTDSDVVISFCGDAGSGAIMLQGPPSNGSFAGPAITNTLIAHSLGDGIVAGVNANGTTLSTDYTAAKLNITFQDIAGKNIDTTCN